MQILLVNKFHYLKGGSEKYYFELADLLKEKGHEVAFFSMFNEKNIKTDCKEYMVKNTDMNSKNVFKAFSVIYSKANKKKMIEALEDFKPDIVHINNFQRQLSASIIDAIKEKKIPIVFTAHDVQAVCPAITMLNNEMNICEKCMGGKYKNCIKNRCNKGSILKSTIGAIEGKYYRNKKIYSKKIDYIITPSEFYRKKLIEDGIPENKIEAIHNGIDIKEYEINTTDEGYALYIGRLSKEKGIINLILAFQKLKEGKLYIAGDGPEKDNILSFIKENQLQDKIKLLGFLDKDNVKKVLSKCKFVVVPSIWYENCPYSVLETLTIGKPVIGANIGGIPELVQDNFNGFTYEYNSIDELSEKMKKLFDDEKLLYKMSKNAKEQAIALYNKERYYEKIISIYEKVIKENNKN